MALDSSLILLLVLIFNVFVALVAANNPVDTKKSKADEELKELLEDDLLLLANKNTSFNSRTALRLHPQSYVTMAPPTVMTPHPLPSNEKLLFEVEDLLPTEIVSRELLSRDKRQVIGSGEEDTTASARITFDELFLPGIPITDAMNATVAADLLQAIRDFGVDATSLTITAVVDESGNAQYQFTITFSSAAERQTIAYALVRICRSQTEIAGLVCADNPQIENAAGMLVNAICLLCPVDRPCTSDGECAPYSTAASSSCFEYGLTEADIKLPRGDDVTSDPVNVPGDGFPFGSQYVNDIYVGDNGILSFERAFNPYNLRNFRFFRNRKYFCVYCRDLDNRYAGGEVYYQTYTAGETYAELMLDRANAEIHEHTPYSEFKASWVFVVTWKDIPIFTRFRNPVYDQFNTFQLVLITDGTRSFARLCYENTVASPGLYGWRSSSNYFFELLVSRRRGNMQRVRGNTGVRGNWLFEIGSVPGLTDAARCWRWFLANLPLRQRFLQRSSVLRIDTCPCRRNVLLRDPRFWPLPPFFNQEVYCAPMRGSLRSDTFECCYDRSGSFIPRYPRGGGYNRFSITVAPRRRIRQDVLPKDWCCRGSNLCGFYRNVRPESSCSRRLTRVLRFALGDPHFTTLDGKTFTFNGIGEYRLIELEPEDRSFSFKLQCRTSQATLTNGTKVQASFFSAFAAEQTSTTLPTAKVQVGMTEDKSKLTVYIQDVDVSSDFNNDINFPRVQPYLTVTRQSDTRIEIAFPQTEIAVTIQIVEGTLSQSTTIPDDYRGLPIGLLGNFNGNNTDDFRFPDGTLLSATSTDEQLFSLGRAWAVTSQSSSILHYTPQQTIATFTDDSFRPLFYSEIPAADIAAATQVCGVGEEQCIYDYALTKNQQLANAATTQLEEAARVTTELENRAPSLTGTNKVDVQVGNQVSLFFQANDVDGDPVTYVIVNGSSSFTLDDTTGIGQFSPANSDFVRLRIAAEDSSGARSPALDVQVRLCDGCGVNGKCDYSTPRTPVTSEEDSLFQIASCVCNIGYTGDTCSEDEDGCADDPCGLGRICTDLTPDVEVASGEAFNCSDCTTGFVLSDGSVNQKCENVDECLTEDSCPANSTCTDTVGSYLCTCNVGFRKNSVGRCVDIDECFELLHQCEQTCTNTEGSFTCGCYTGYTLSESGTGCNETNLPATCSGFGCGQFCAANESGDAVCRCMEGYELADNFKDCKDVDECGLSLCAQNCNNTVGSYACSCLSGYTLDQDNLNCVRCEFPNYGDNCQSTCDCQGRATECDPVHGCVCNAAWTGTDCGTNVNECIVTPNICGDQQSCTDTEGSYTCSCASGYVVNGTECEDDDECLAITDDDICPDNSVCENLIGSFVCNCNPGYRKDGNECVDIDECTTGQAMCHQLCQNKEGSYNCYCNEGYTLNDDRKTCSKALVSPCDGLTNLQCDHFCAVENNIATCKCNRGYFLSADQETCLDVDECADDTLNLCTFKDTCSNTPGSYTCLCRAGQEIQNDGRTCVACDDNHWGENCVNECGCVPLGTNTCDKIQGCVCKSGWTGTTCSENIDECATTVCTANSDCVDLAESYACICRTGYRASGTGDQLQCNEINECDSPADNMCDHICHDTVGSYYCSCSPGFLLEGQGTCTDIDECTAGTHDCQQLCRNTAGAFTCECYEGYELDPVGRKTCTPIPGAAQCSSSNTCDPTNGGCRLNGTEETCFCNRGYELAAGGTTCNDIDECTTANVCNDTCSNAPSGSFTCSCSAGFQLAGDKISCEECPEGKWGVECANNCTCDSSNTISCNAVDGSCTCRTGWDGNTCTTDILECTNDPDICGTNGVCNERGGSFACTCTAGYIRSNDICQPCTSTKWGLNCNNACRCNFTNTVTCDSVTGQCDCKSGWTGDICSTNINECMNTTSPVCTGSNEVCRDVDGSFACDCTSGFEKAPNNSVCIDTNECLLPTVNTCRFQCNNTYGSFNCMCPLGYLGSGNNCTANFGSYLFAITLDLNEDNIIDLGSTSSQYKKLQEDIGNGLDDVFNSLGSTALLPATVVELRKGSVVAPTVIRIDRSQTDNEDGLLAAVLEKVADVGSINVGGSPTAITSVVYNDIPIVKNHTVCDVLLLIRSLSSDEYCEEDSNGIPVVKKLTDAGPNVPLIAGLTAAILIIVVVLILAIVYICCCRKSRSSQRTPSEERDAAFRSAFVGNLPTKGNFGASRYMMYSPHTLSDASTRTSRSSSERYARRGNKNQPYEFGNMPQWVDDRGAGPSRRDDRAHDPSSNFSWEHLFDQLQPHRNGQFEVPRPAVNVSPRRAFRDSLA